MSFAAEVDVKRFNAFVKRKGQPDRTKNKQFYRTSEQFRLLQRQYYRTSKRKSFRSLQRTDPTECVTDLD